MSLVTELRRRQVFRAAAWYAAAAWVAIQVASTVIPQFGLPDWLVRAVIVAGRLRPHASGIEDALGRVRPPGTPEARRFAPRSVDIDILFYGDEVISGPDDLHVPHLLLAERAFVLRPLSDVAPDLEHPTLYATVRQLLDELADDHRIKPGAYPARWFED